MKNILIVDDSALMRRVMSDIINSDQELHIANAATNGLEGLTLLQEGEDYDLVLLDINMPKMDGVAFLENLNRLGIKVRVIVVSSIASKSAEETIRALELGAFDFIRKPDNYLGSANQDFKTLLLNKVRVALGIDHSFEQSEWKSIKEIATKNEMKPQVTLRKKGIGKIVFIASSTGGPKSLQQVIPKFPKNFPYPIVIVQHMPEGFTKSLAKRLDEMSEIEVFEAENGAVLKPGTAYIAMGGMQCRIVQVGKEKYQLSLMKDEARNGLRPCADIFLESLAETEYEEIICAVLTGMGDDATRGVAYLKQYKNVTVVGQSQETCVVYGMPRAIKAAGMVDHEVALENVAEKILEQLS